MNFTDTILNKSSQTKECKLYYIIHIKWHKARKANMCCHTLGQCSPLGVRDSRWNGIQEGF